MKIQTANLTGKYLDYALILANKPVLASPFNPGDFESLKFYPSQDWKAAVSLASRRVPEAVEVIYAEQDGWGTNSNSPGMELLRGFVQAELGNEVEFPDDF